jgi:DNA-damage-inducible protein J
LNGDNTYENTNNHKGRSKKLFASQRNMRMKTQTTIRVDQKNYLQAKEILKYLGLTYSQAINVFNNMIVCHKGLPFEIKIPNDETLAAMSEAEQLDGDFVSIDDFVK